MYRWNIPVLNQKNMHSMICPFWETDNDLYDTLITWSLCETHGKPDSHLPGHGKALCHYVGIQKLDISSIKKK